MNQPPTAACRRRLGAVSYLNAKPLVEGLDAAAGIDVTFAVPSLLPDLLNRGRVDAALTPVIDVARFASDWEIVSDACIGCDGETLTVRVFSRVSPEAITRLHVDGDSHTARALAAVLWRERYGRCLEIGRFEPWESEACQAVLLIGDKVVNHRLDGFTHEVDLGSAWKSLTGLPFVFAAWARRRDTQTADLGPLLCEARNRGLAAVETIAAKHAPALGWPIDQAVLYLTEHLEFTLTPRHIEGMELFFKLASRAGVLPPEREIMPA